MQLNNDIKKLLLKLRTESPESYNHCVNVAKIAMLFGKYINLKNEDIEKLRLAGLLHDIGKLCISKEILHKQGKLTPSEYEIIKKHVILACELLKNNNFKGPDVLELILDHHERIDGQGYPLGIKGESIPELARILTICDSYDAMRLKRCYKKDETIEYIKKELINNSGTQFDYNYVKEFLEFLDYMMNKASVTLSYFC